MYQYIQYVRRELIDFVVTKFNIDDWNMNFSRKYEIEQSATKTLCTCWKQINNEEKLDESFHGISHITMWSHAPYTEQHTDILFHWSGFHWFSYAVQTFQTFVRILKRLLNSQQPWTVNSESNLQSTIRERKWKEKEKSNHNNNDEPVNIL